MNNLIRLVLEVITLKEHNKINPIEDANRIGLENIERYMNAAVQLSELAEGKYCSEIERLYGDSDKDGNYCVLKALLTEVLKEQTNLDEFERIYQTITNHVRRNKIKNIDFLQFLKEYSEYQGTFYNFVLMSKAEVASRVFNGHELEKIAICSEFCDINKEKAIWTEQSSDFWNGEMYTTPHFLDKAKGKTLPLAKTKKRDGKKEQVRRLIQVESGHRGVERGLHVT